jgi:hypothetical protein
MPATANARIVMYIHRVTGKLVMKLKAGPPVPPDATSSQESEFKSSFYLDRGQEILVNYGDGYCLNTY